MGFLFINFLQDAKMPLLFLLLSILIHLGSAISIDDYYKKLAREAPFCVDETVNDVKNFQPVFKYYNQNPQTVVHVATTQEIPDHEEIDWTQTNADGIIPQHKAPYEHKYKHLTITFNRINPTPVKPKYQLFNLRQWFHIHVKSEKPLIALYIQPFSAPLGVPFGEFRNDFNCLDCKGKDEKSHYNVTDSHFRLVPCKFRSFHSNRHPYVAVIGGKGSEEPFHDAHIHFNWLEGMCQEVALMQFLIVAVKDFTRIPKGFDVFYSQVINNTIQDSIDGTASPYYADFEDKMLCHSAPLHSDKHWTADMMRAFDPLKARPYIKQHSRLIYNKNYDDCVKNNGAGGDGNRQCPPGPFRCTQADGNYYGYREFPANTQRRIKFHSGNDSEVCPSCFDTNFDAPPLPPSVRNLEESEIQSFNGKSRKGHTREHSKNSHVSRHSAGAGHRHVGGHNKKRKHSGTGLVPEGMEVQDVMEEEEADLDPTAIEKQFWLNANQTNLMIRQTHGTLMILSWITIPLIGNYISRFYKETGHAQQGIQCGNVGFWLWGHIGLSYSSLTAMWGGMAVVFFYDGTCRDKEMGDDFACYESYHQLPAIIAVILFHVNHLNGWCRPLSTPMRKIYIYWHVLFGYGSQLIAVVSFFLVHDSVDFEVSLAILFSFGVAAVFYILSTILQIYIDKNLQLVVRRTLFPVPEAIGVATEDGCMGSLRAMLLVLFVLSQVFLFVWVVVAQHKD